MLVVWGPIAGELAGSLIILGARVVVLGVGGTTLSELGPFARVMITVLVEHVI